MSREFISKFLVCVGVFVAVVMLAFVGINLSSFVASAEETEVDLASAEITRQPKSAVKNYGSTVRLRVKINIDDANCGYEWYRSASETGTMIKVAEGISQEPEYSVTQISESGYYYCVITSVRLGGKTAKVNLTSDKVYAEIQPKPIQLIYAPKRYVYNGKRQVLDVKVDNSQVLEGDRVSVLTEYNTSTTTIGTYTVKLSLNNSNYIIDGSDEASFTIERAPLEVTVKDAFTVLGTACDFEFLYNGFVNGETIDTINFTPSVDESSFNLDKVGTYNVMPMGETECGNYVMRYRAGKLYVNSSVLSGGEISSDLFVTANGSFRPGTWLYLNTIPVEEVKDSFFITKIVSNAYAIGFNAGSADSETYTVKIDGVTLPSFMLAVCCIDSEGTSIAVEDFKYYDNSLTVTVPAEYEGKIVVYNDYTLLIFIGGIVALILFILIIVLIADKIKYRKAIKISNAAKREADKFRYHNYR